MFLHLHNLIERTLKLYQGPAFIFSFVNIEVETYVYVASLVAQSVKNLPALRETQVQSLGQEDPLEKGMVTHSSIPAWRIQWTEEPGQVQSMESQRVEHD